MSLWDSLERWGATVFLVAGGLATVFLINTLLTTFTGTSYPVVGGLVGPIGFLISVVGLFGLYPALADRTPRLARVAAVVAVIPLLGWTTIIVGGLGEAVGVWGQPPEWAAILPLITIVTMLLAFGLFGVTNLRAGVHSRIVGGLLLVESAMYLLLLSGAVPAFVIDIGHVVALLGVGIALRTEGVPTESTDPAADATP
jgi:hypothetical protein